MNVVEKEKALLGRKKTETQRDTILKERIYRS